jgi:hypothetical protein
VSFADDLARFQAKTANTLNLVFVGAVADAHSSIQVGSAVTGSPGQPVGQYGPGYHPGETGGELRASWNIKMESPTVALISTNRPYAESNEDGIARPGGGGYTLRSTVGGRWSVKYTIAGFGRIVDAVVARVAR